MSDAGRERGGQDDQQREAELVRARLMELTEEPIQGAFDLPHLRAVHAYIFQDLPHHRPGVIRERTEKSWVKARLLEGRSTCYLVHYAHDGIEDKMTDALVEFGGPGAIKSQPPEIAAARLAELYGDLDYAHGFYEGNSRTLREFTRELALEAGFELDWIRTDIGAGERNKLYVARDLEVLKRAFPDLTPKRAMQTESRPEYEALVQIDILREEAGDHTLAAIIGGGFGFPDWTTEEAREGEPVDQDQAGLRDWTLDEGAGLPPVDDPEETTHFSKRSREPER